MKHKKSIIITSSIISTLAIGTIVATSVLVSEMNTVHWKINYKDYMDSDRYLDFNDEISRQNPLLLDKWGAMRKISNSFGHTFYDNWFNSLTYNPWLFC